MNEINDVKYDDKCDEKNDNKWNEMSALLSLSQQFRKRLYQIYFIFILVLLNWQATWFIHAKGK